MHTYHVDTCIHRCTHTHTTCSHAYVTPLCLHVLLCMNTSIKRTFMYSRFHNQTFCVLCLTSRSCAKKIWSADEPWIKWSELYWSVACSNLRTWYYKNCSVQQRLSLCSVLALHSVPCTKHIQRNSPEFQAYFPFSNMGIPSYTAFFPIVLLRDLHVEKREKSLEPWRILLYGFRTRSAV